MKERNIKKSDEWRDDQNIYILWVKNLFWLLNYEVSFILIIKIFFILFSSLNFFIRSTILSVFVVIFNLKNWDKLFFSHIYYNKLISKLINRKNIKIFTLWKKIIINLFSIYG